MSLLANEGYTIAAGITLSQVGFIISVLAGVLGTMSGFPIVQKRIGPNLLEEARRQLYDCGSLVKGDEEFDAIVRVVREKWEGELTAPPATLLLEKPHMGSPKSLLAIYDEGSHGPYGDRMEKVRAGEEPPPVDEDEIWESEKWDWICGKQVLDGWTNEAIEQRTNLIRVMQWTALVLIIIGALAQVPSTFY